MGPVILGSWDPLIVDLGPRMGDPTFTLLKKNVMNLMRLWALSFLSFAKLLSLLDLLHYAPPPSPSWDPEILGSWDPGS